MTISDDEGTGSVAVALWMPRETQFKPLLTRVDLPGAWLRTWSNDYERSTTIMEVEAVGPLLALSMWPEILRDALWLHFVDNESAKFSLIRGSSRACHLNRIVHETWHECQKRKLYPWFERVSTKDNPVDQASRKNMNDLYSQRWRIVPPKLPDL